MTKDILESLVNKNLTIVEIANELDVSYSCIRYWLKKYNLKTNSLFYLNDRFKFTNEELLIKWKESDSINQFLINLGVTNSGGAWYHYQKRLKSIGIDTKIGILPGRSRGGKKTAEIRNKETIKRKIRLPRPTLKKAMDLNNIEYKCNGCGISEWKNKKLKLHIHHKDHNKENNEISNLEYKCPNCHSIEHYTEK